MIRKPPLMRYFTFSHLTNFQARTVSKSFAELAHALSESLPDDNPESTVALRKLLEAKDCAVRAVLPDRGPTDLASELRDSELMAGTPTPHTHRYELNGSTYGPCTECGQSIDKHDLPKGSPASTRSQD